MPWDRDRRWEDVLVERRARPPVLSEDRFREWLSGQAVFISSRMDEEMNPHRRTAREVIAAHGGQAVMWEDLAPRDASAERAYLEGVDRSTVFVLLLGSTYGVTDHTGYSPTHKEWIRAEDLGIPRLVFELSGVDASQRDGRLNDWLRSMQRQVSTLEVEDSAGFQTSMLSRLREMAAQQLTPWIKLGQLVFPGRVRRRGGRSGSIEIVVNAHLRDGRLRRAVSDLSHSQHQIRADRLTWPHESHPVQVREVEIATDVPNQDQVEITCTFPSQYFGPTSGAVGGSFGMRFGDAGPAEQAALWVRRAVFGEEIRPQGSADLLHSVTTPDGPTLPALLAGLDLHGWRAEGVARLYLIEGLIVRHGGHFDRLELGPATRERITVQGHYVPAGHGSEAVELNGYVQLPT